MAMVKRTLTNNSMLRLAILVPLSCFGSILLSFVLNKAANLLYGKTLGVAIIAAALMFFSSVLINNSKKVYSKSKSLMKAFAKRPLWVRAIIAGILGFACAHFLGFWVQNLADFVSREINIVTVLMCVGSELLARGKVPFAKRSAQAKNIEENDIPEEEPHVQTLEEFSEDLGNEFADVVDEQMDFDDDEVLP